MQPTSTDLSAPRFVWMKLFSAFLNFGNIRWSNDLPNLDLTSSEELQIFIVQCTLFSNFRVSDDSLKVDQTLV